MKEDQNQLHKIASDDTREDYSCKRQKVVSFNDNCTYVSIASCYDSDYDTNNHQSPDRDQQLLPLKETEVSTTSISCHANDHILMIFYSSANTSSYSFSQISVVRPSFTHQLFPDELILLPSSVFHSTFRIFVFIDEVDLSHSVYINGIHDEKVMESLKESLSKGIPEDTIYLTEKPSFIEILFETLFEKDKTVSFSLAFPVSSLLSTAGSATSKEEASDHPPGILLHSFDISPFTKTLNQSETKENRKFELYLSGNADPKASFILKRFEKIAMWFIETADSIDFTDHRWELLLLYEKLQLPLLPSSFPSSSDSSSRSSPSFSFVLSGYMTLFTFHNPFAGDSLRVCQALILPKNQNLGLGREILFATNQLTEERTNVIQITVEDPCEGFQRLRYLVDFEWYVLRYGLIDKMKEITPLPAVSDDSPSTDSIFVPWHQLDSSTSIASISETLKIIKNQVYFVKEAYEYIQLIVSSLKDEYNKQQLSQLFNDENKENKKGLHSALHQLVIDHPNFPEFRLSVKKNLVYADKELKQLPKVEMQRELVRLFDERLNLYQTAIGTAIRLKLITN
jgi:hypothetical protein